MHVINLGVYCLQIKVELFSHHNCSICIFCIAIYVLYFKCTHNTVHFATFILSHNVQYMLKQHVVNWLATLMWCIRLCVLVYLWSCYL